MRILELAEIRRTLVYKEIISSMRGAVTAWSRGECDMPMPMHLDIEPAHGEVHMKSSYRRGGRYFALKIAATFPDHSQASPLTPVVCLVYPLSALWIAGIPRA